jgi:hypothetical protein
MALVMIFDEFDVHSGLLIKQLLMKWNFDQMFDLVIIVFVLIVGRYANQSPEILKKNRSFQGTCF